MAQLNPESVTVHSLSMKHSSNLSISGDFPEIEIGKTASDMVDYANSFLEEMQIYPYYMYRQSKTVGNLENVGYAKPGTMSTYNVNIMEEKQTIVALGGGGSSKVIIGDRIERVFNFKDPLEYTRRFDEILTKKYEILSLMKEES